jgi:transposase-like protein
MARVEVITGPERRRRWSENQKRAIIAASLAPGAVVSDVARRADVCPGQIYRWRKELCAAPAGFAEMPIAPAATVASDAGGRRGLTNATKRSNDFRCPERARISWGKPCEVGVRGKDLILSRSGQRHIDALCVPNFNQRMYVGWRRQTSLPG